MAEGGNGLGPEIESVEPGPNKVTEEKIKEGLAPTDWKHLKNLSSLFDSVVGAPDEEQIRREERELAQKERKSQEILNPVVKKFYNQASEELAALPVVSQEAIDRAKAGLEKDLRTPARYPDTQEIILHAAEDAFTISARRSGVSDLFPAHSEDPKENFSTMSAQKIEQKYKDHPEIFEYQYLLDILDEERADLEAIKDTFEDDPEIKRLSVAAEAAIEFLTDPKNLDTPTDDPMNESERAVNISLIEEDDGSWKATPGAEGDYFTITAPRALQILDNLSPFQAALGKIDLAKEALQSLITGEPLKFDPELVEADEEKYDQDERVMALDVYLREKAGAVKDMIPNTQPENRKSNYAFIALLDAYRDRISKHFDDLQNSDLGVKK
ncbi:MAG TPA: hypothetical protein VNA13_00795 [Xanthomonadales bacterium]|nr:hypothetical protein [Xanthomonadales bacterium]